MAIYTPMEAQFTLMILGKATTLCFVVLIDLTAAMEEIDTENFIILMELKWVSRVIMSICIEIEDHG